MRARTVFWWAMVIGLAVLYSPIATAQEQQPAYIVLVDTSGSMNNEPQPQDTTLNRGWGRAKLVIVKQKLGSFLSEELPAGTEVYFYTFNERIPDPDAPLVHVRVPDGSGLLLQQIEGLQAGGGTYAWDSLRVVLGKARELIRLQPNRRINLLMFTDGEDSKYRTTDELARLLDEYSDILLSKAPLQVVTIGFLLGHEEKTLLEAVDAKIVENPIADEVIPTTVDFRWAPTQPTTETTVQFHNDSSGPGITGYTWLFGDGRSSNEREPQHQYQKPGEYELQLVLHDRTGQEHRGEPKTIIVTPAATPLLARGRIGITEIPLGQPAVFINESEGGPTSFEWDFGDGSISVEEHPTHLYARGGTYTVHLAISRKGSEAVSAAIGTVTVHPPEPPKARAHHNSHAFVNEQVLFLDESEGLIDEREWGFGDGSPSAIGRKAEHVYDKPDTYAVTLRVSGPGGQRAFESSITISTRPAPVAAMSLGTSNPRVDDEVVFTDLSEGLVKRAEWNFGDQSEPQLVYYGDGSTAADRQVKHRFMQPGSYSVQLKVEGPGGEDEARSEPIEIEPRIGEPQAVFRFDRPQSAGPLTVRFQNLSKGRIARFIWDFGDGVQHITESAEDVSHEFAAGRWEVTLTAEGMDGFAPSRSTQPLAVPAWWQLHWWKIGLATIVGLACLFGLLRLWSGGRRRPIYGTIEGEYAGQTKTAELDGRRFDLGDLDLEGWPPDSKSRHTILNVARRDGLHVEGGLDGPIPLEIGTEFDIEGAHFKYYL